MVTYSLVLPAASILSSTTFLCKALRFFFIYLVFVPVIWSSTSGKKTEKMKQWPQPSTPPALLQSAALTRLSWQTLEMCLASLACSRENTGQSECRKGGTWKAVKLCLSSLPLLPFPHQSACLFFRRNHCSSSRRGWGESAWMNSVSAPLFPICTLILSGLQHGLEQSKAFLTFQSVQGVDENDGASVCVCWSVFNTLFTTAYKK